MLLEMRAPFAREGDCALLRDLGALSDLSVKLRRDKYLTQRSQRAAEIAENRIEEST